MKHVISVLMLGAFGATGVAQDKSSPWKFEIETGAVAVNKNIIQLPGQTGTRFRFDDLVGERNLFFARYELTHETEAGIGWRLLFAPLSQTGTGRFTSAVNFNGTTFGAGTDTDGLYKFNSYRLTYRTRWKQSPKSHWRVGFTGKIRDAEVRLAQGATSSSFTNVGFVPLLHVYGEESLSAKTRLVFDFDGLAGGPGRAFDVAIKLGFDLSPKTSVLVGYRMLEGGADNDRVFNFSVINYGSLTFQVRF